MKKIIIITITAFCFFAAPVLFAESEDGGYAGAFLKLSVAARPASMGGAYIGVSDDVFGQLYNPSGTVAISQKTFASSYRVMKLDRKLGFVSFIIPTKRESCLGISWLYAGYGEVMRRNSSGLELGSTISSNEHIFGISFAKQFTPALGIGTKLGYYHKQFGEISANSIGINFGATLYIDSLMPIGSMQHKPITDLKVGVVFNNLSAKYSWSSDSQELAATQDDKFPYVIGVGGSFRLFKKSLLIAGDLEKNMEQAIVARFGTEYSMKNGLFLRGGLNEGTITAGFGYNFMFGDKSLMFNYAFSADRVDEGDDHIISLDLRF
jgi:hypothetical protein